MRRAPLARSARHKYGNAPTRCSEGVMHQSKLEATRCTELHLMQRGGLIRDLVAHPQPTYRLEVNGVLIAKFSPDFEYVDADGARRVEDTKGFLTRDADMKLKLMRALYGVDVELVRRGRKW